eukprot:COSAG03_NODE_2270_length_2933_cov_1.792519_1_plen_211_part_00
MIDAHGHPRTSRVRMLPRDRRPAPARPPAKIGKIIMRAATRSEIGRSREASATCCSPACSALLLPAARGVRRLHGRDGGVRLLGILQTDLMLARHRKWASCAAVAAGVASTWLTGSCARPAASCANRTSTTESDHEPAPRYSDDAQAGGHVDGVRFMGAMLHKRLQDEGRGDREVAALAALAQSPRWRDYVPRYGGLRTEPAGRESWLLM